MKITEIYPNNLFAVHFDEKNQNEYESAFTLWQDLDYLINYFSANSSLLESDFWKSVPIPTDYEDLAINVVNESFDLQKYIQEIATNTSNGEGNDFDSFFQELGGKYKNLRQYIPQKAYGTNTPTMLRLYAIRIEKNCYLIVHGGIKLTKEIHDTPTLRDELFVKIDNVLQFLRANGILDKEDLKEE